MVPFRFNSYTKEEIAAPLQQRKEGAGEREERDEDFNRYRPMFPQSKLWKAKTADQPVRPVEPSTEATAESAPPVSVSSVDEAPAVPPTAEDEELVNYEASPEHTNLEVNVVHLSSDYFVVPEEDMAHL